ncbi:MAG: hypothetical protein ABJC07_12875 [Acidobacteriota bacterium]
MTEPSGGDTGVPPRSRPTWVLLLQRGSGEVLYEAAAMTAAAVSLGLAVTIVWFDGAFEALVSGQLDPEDASVVPGTAAGAGRLLAEARATGHVRYLGCSAALVARSGGKPLARDRVDDVVGWPTAISLIRSAERAFVW